MIDYQVNKARFIVKGIRSFLGLSQHDIAEIIHTSQSTISKIEAGKLEFSALEWILFCDYFFIDANCLITGKVRLDVFKLNKAYSHIHIKVKKKSELEIETFISLIDYIKSNFGEVAFKQLLERLNLDESFLSIMNNKLSLNRGKELLTCVYESLAER